MGDALLLEVDAPSLYGLLISSWDYPLKIDILLIEGLRTRVAYISLHPPKLGVLQNVFQSIPSVQFFLIFTILLRGV